MPGRSAAGDGEPAELSTLTGRGSTVGRREGHRAARWYALHMRFPVLHLSSAAADRHAAQSRA
ncbi:hypothetical protein [Streptomyces sp. NPDC020917]|uniref:hypothetical protein n=1 Tax=Streptomyces sp. NPDC020917 TaxID=3365102 RepID=UPI00379793C1